ncbi:MAG: SCP2 sterol-binding domain-containing protein [Acidimicrobiia bacterium]|nr:SCP2 sterol-binding domain-containing protein [Acidimicrobiia bacterium]
MAMYLSDEWGREMEKAVNADEEFQQATSGMSLVLQHVVNNVPGRETVEYWFEFEDGSITYHPGKAERKPDGTVTQSYETSAALNRGEVNSQVAISQGKVKITGNLGKILQAAPALDSMVPVLQALPTEY